MKTINYFKPAIGEEEINEAVACLKSGWLTTGNRAFEFENDFVKYMGNMSYGVALNSCTAALHLALKAMDLKPGDIVLVPTLTFVATVEVVCYFNAVPVFIDCKEDDFCIDLDKAEEYIVKINNGESVPGLPANSKNKVKGIIPVHFAGQAVDVKKLKKLIKKYNLFNVEDCAHCIPAYYKDEDSKDQFVGTSANVACYSFYANKAITTGEGGMALTDSKEMADYMRVMSLHGMNKEAWNRFNIKGSWYFEVHEPGYKYNMSDIAASIGLQQLKKADDFWKRRVEIALLYEKYLSGAEGLILPAEVRGNKHSWHLYIIRIDADNIGISRDQIYDALKQHGIGTGVHYTPVHLHPYYAKKYNIDADSLPVAVKLYEQILSLPIYPGLTDDDIFYICETLKRLIS